MSWWQCAVDLEANGSNIKKIREYHDENFFFFRGIYLWCNYSMWQNSQLHKKKKNSFCTENICLGMDQSFAECSKCRNEVSGSKRWALEVTEAIRHIICWCLISIDCRTPACCSPKWTHPNCEVSEFNATSFIQGERWTTFRLQYCNAHSIAGSQLQF